MNGELVGKKSLNLKTDIFLGIIFLIFLLQNGSLGNIPIALLFIPLFFCGSVFKLSVGDNEKKILLYFAYLFLVTIINIDTNFDVNYTINMFVQYIIIYVCITSIVPKIDSNKVLYFLRNFGVFLSVLCIPESIFGVHFLADLLNKKVIAVSRVVSIFNHPIVAGVFFLITLVLVMVYPYKQKFGQVCAFAVVIIAIILTQSRNAWIAAAFVICAYCYKYNFKKIKVRYLLYAILGSVVLILGAALLGHNIVFDIWSFIYNRIKGSLDAGEGQIIRIEVIINSVNYWKDNVADFLFGRGKNFGLLFMKHNPIIKFKTFIWDTAIDNQYITLIHETGVIGLGLILSVVIANIKRYLKVSPSNKEQVAVGLCLLGNSICLFFFEGFHYPILVMLYLILIIIGDNNWKMTVSKADVKRD